MVFDIRGHAGDRLKTAEEMVKEERERLETLEVKSDAMTPLRVV